MTFGDYVAEKTIALVGPAKPVGDQSAEIEAHDLVYRLGFIDAIPAEYGTRTDIALLNSRATRTLYDDEWYEHHRHYWNVPWLIMKTSQGMRRQGNYRKASKPPHVRNPNQATLALYDLLQHHPGPSHITVYGVDLYSSGPVGFYHDNYLNFAHTISKLGDLSVHATAFLGHRPWEQMRLHRAVHATGRVVGDDRYLAAVTMTDDEYQAVIDRWKAVLEEANA